MKQLSLDGLTSSADGDPVLVVNGKDASFVVTRLRDAGGQEVLVILSFEGCLQSISGYPNDEARNKARREPDLSGGGVYEIRGSDWLDRLRAFNREAFPRADWWPHGTYRHFVVAGLESTHQFLAERVEVKVMRDRAAAIATAVSWASGGVA